MTVKELMALLNERPPDDVVFIEDDDVWPVPLLGVEESRGGYTGLICHYGHKEEEEHARNDL